MKLVIIFMGLITHMTAENSDDRLAVFVEAIDPPHQTWLRVRPDDIDKNHTPTFESITEGCDARYLCYALGGQRVRVIGLPPSSDATEVDDTFDDHVPHLREITHSTVATGTVRVHEKIHAGEEHSSADGHLRFHGGRLSVERVWDTEIRFKPQLQAPGAMYVAHDVVFTSDPIAADYVEFRSADKSIRVKSSAKVYIENLPLQNPAPPHFHNHRRVLDNVTLMAQMQRTGNYCTGSVEGLECKAGIPGPRPDGTPHAHYDVANVGFGANYECTNSAYP
jgi:hypothetical protein